MNIKQQLEQVIAEMRECANWRWEGIEDNFAFTGYHDLAMIGYADRLSTIVEQMPSASAEPDGMVPAQFPTMLRKMWSGTEVQRWLDDNKAMIAAAKEEG